WAECQRIGRGFGAGRTRRLFTFGPWRCAGFGRTSRFGGGLPRDCFGCASFGGAGGLLGASIYGAGLFGAGLFGAGLFGAGFLLSAALSGAGCGRRWRGGCRLLASLAGDLFPRARCVNLAVAAR